MWVTQLRGELDLAQEAISTHGGGEFGAQYFHGDLALVPQVTGEKHNCHSAAADLILDGVAVGKGRLQVIRKLCHGGDN
jgi:hypothetical protein